MNLAAASAELSWPICGKLKLIFVCSSGEMLDVLVAPTHDLVTRHPQVTLRTFVDDRIFTGPVANIIAMKDDWHIWSDACWV